jgi:sporulation protein YlmC with PRC-barrel domain
MVTLVLGSKASYGDGQSGEVLAVVVDPVKNAVTHVAVEPEGRRGLARLVPLRLVALAGMADPADLADLGDAARGPVRLRCTEAEFEQLDAAEQTLAEFTLGYEVPVQLIEPGWRDAGGPAVEGGTIPRIPEQETIDIVPSGEVEERRGDHVHATDGDIGPLRALRIDPGSGRVTHVLVRQGRLWAHKDVAIPFGEVAGLDDGIRLSITKRQVRDLLPG